MRKKVLVIGLDGATFNVIQPLIEKDRLPNLKRLMEEGASGSLQSTIPPLTGPAWLSLATGMTPEKTGVYDFVSRREGSYRLRGITSAEYFGRSLWDYLGGAGKRVGILNYPMLMPPYEVNGFMTAGIGSSQYDDYTFPRELKGELNKVVGSQYELMVPYHESRYDDIDLFLADLNRVFDKQSRATEYLIQEKEWDIFWVVFSETDWAQHILWRFIDENHPLYEREKGEKYKKAFKGFWSKVDETIGLLRQIVGEETTIFILSDHGFGPNTHIFKLNAWLEREGYLFRKNPHGTLVKKAVFSSLKRIVERLKLQRLVPDLYKRGQKAVDNLRVGVVELIDLEKSLAFDPGHTIQWGGIYINDQLITRAQDRRRIATEIAERLKKWGSQFGIKVEAILLDGRINEKLRDKAPDLIIGINNWGCVILKDIFDGNILEERPYSLRHTGSHRPNGIFIAAGPDIKRSAPLKARLWDVAPTVLYFFDAPVPKDMDGRVLTEIFTPDHLKKHPVRYHDEESERHEKGELFLTEEEEKALGKRLRDLGYM